MTLAYLNTAIYHPPRPLPVAADVHASTQPDCYDLNCVVAVVPLETDKVVLEPLIVRSKRLV
jgi:hypothetical protein